MIVRSALLLAALALPAAPAFAQEQTAAVPYDAEPPPLPPAAPAPRIQRAIPPSPFTIDQRIGWLNQCRNTYLSAGASFAGAPGEPDLCETQLFEFERTYVPSADGLPPVLWVRVPLSRVPALPAPAEQADDLATEEPLIDAGDE